MSPLDMSVRKDCGIAERADDVSLFYNKDTEEVLLRMCS